MWIPSEVTNVPKISFKDSKIYIFRKVNDADYLAAAQKQSLNACSEFYRNWKFYYQQCI